MLEIPVPDIFAVSHELSSHKPEPVPGSTNLSKDVLDLPEFRVNMPDKTPEDATNRNLKEVLDSNKPDFSTPEDIQNQMNDQNETAIGLNDPLLIANMDTGSGDEEVDILPSDEIPDTSPYNMGSGDKQEITYLPQYDEVILGKDELELNIIKNRSLESTYIDVEEASDKRSIKSVVELLGGQLIPDTGGIREKNGAVDKTLKFAQKNDSLVLSDPRNL